VDQQAFETGRAAYQAGDFATAVAAFNVAKTPGELNGALDHMRGNALMKLGMFPEAAVAYAEALQDVSYGKQGALHANRGRALTAAGNYDAAIDALSLAATDPDYATPYKAYMALGGIYDAKKMPREAGAAYRNAAIDETNPDPASALAKLGACFMELGRPIDAVEAYRTALDFSTPAINQAAIYAQLGSAFVASNRMSEALDAFQHAQSEGGYTLTPQESAAMVAAQNAVAALTGLGRSDTDALLAAAGYGTGAIDPLDPLGKSGEFIPSPEDTGFFSITEQDIVEADRKAGKVRKKKKRGGKIAAVILIILIILVGVAGYGYYSGYGWPTQQTVVEDVFKAKTDNGDLGSYLAGTVSSDTRTQIESIIPSGATASITSVDRSMYNSTVKVAATLSQGGTQDYVFDLVRDGLGWKVSNVTLSFDSTGGSATASSTDSTSSTSSTDASSTTSTDSSASTSTAGTGAATTTS
jgi:tetratricopeptide (TPR) repeat protein